MENVHIEFVGVETQRNKTPEQLAQFRWNSYAAYTAYRRGISQVIETKQLLIQLNFSVIETLQRTLRESVNLHIYTSRIS